ncbi:hypothetical protein MLD38_027094 [Melastoma candidum]|uniref:Uncharacterized protein n=1 Tax=Melastoma candidum TaxID=119954 RepID=A0ACB9P3I2_9MYRT|nr:hypothetical protein MLD38_027094 [Melastoma candidum]
MHSNKTDGVSFVKGRRGPEVPTLDHEYGPKARPVTLVITSQSNPIQSSASFPPLVVGMHFMNPPPVMKLVEIIRCTDTSDETFSATKALAEMSRKTVICSNDYPGFIVNRILMPMINEAFYPLYPTDTDGSLELADFIGLDVCLSVMRVLQDGLGDANCAIAGAVRHVCFQRDHGVDDDHIKNVDKGYGVP